MKTLEKDFDTFVACFWIRMIRNWKKTTTKKDIHSKKLFNLGIESSKTLHNPEKVKFNYLSHVLTESEKSLVCKGLNFAIPSDKLEYSDFWLPFELLYRDFRII